MHSYLRWTEVNFTFEDISKWLNTIEKVIYNAISSTGFKFSFTSTYYFGVWTLKRNNDRLFSQNERFRRFHVQKISLTLQKKKLLKCYCMQLQITWPKILNLIILVKTLIFLLSTYLYHFIHTRLNNIILNYGYYARSGSKFLLS